MILMGVVLSGVVLKSQERLSLVPFRESTLSKENIVFGLWVQLWIAKLQKKGSIPLLANGSLSNTQSIVLLL